MHCLDNDRPLVSDLGDGVCFGAALRWCRLYLDDPEAEPLERMTRLESDMPSILAKQFLSLEIHCQLPAYPALDDAQRGDLYSEYINSLNRVSRLKFTFEFKLYNPLESSGIVCIRDFVDENKVYLLISQLERNLGDHVILHGHCIAMAKNSDESISLFDYNIGEVDIKKGRVEQFFLNFREYWKEVSCKFTSLDGYSMERRP